MISKLVVIILAFVILGSLIQCQQPQPNQFPEMSRRPTLKQRDECIQYIQGLAKSCKDAGNVEEIKKCQQVSYRVDRIINDNGRQSEACHQLSIYFDYENYDSAQLPDAYYQCVTDAKPVALQNKFYYENNFKIFFETCNLN